MVTRNYTQEQQSNLDHARDLVAQLKSVLASQYSRSYRTPLWYREINALIISNLADAWQLLRAYTTHLQVATQMLTSATLPLQVEKLREDVLEFSQLVLVQSDFMVLWLDLQGQVRHAWQRELPGDWTWWQLQHTQEPPPWQPFIDRWQT